MKDLGFEEVIDEQKDFHLRSFLFMLGNDLLIVMSGLHDHIGSITLAQPYTAQMNPNINPRNINKDTGKRISSSISTLTQFHHRDDQILSEFARNISQQLNLVVTVIGGIHIDNISKEEINLISSMLLSLQEKIIKKIKSL